MHWAMAYLGTPWVAGETDCWNFARRVWRERFGRDVPPVGVDVASPLDTRRALRDLMHAEWLPTDAPQEGDAVVMARGTAPCHVGVYLAGGSILHSIEGAGVICTPPGRLQGYQVAGFYRWAE
jgi:cell wall-associated NlpC family hydrolase